MNRRYLYYDKLRIMAMLMVIGVHAVGSIKDYAVSTFAQAEVYILDALNTFGVPLFFALSGVFLLSRTYEDLWGFYKKRLIKVGIPFLIYASLYVVCDVGIDKPLLLPWMYLVKVFTGNVHGTFWFIYAILGLYLATPFLSKMFKNMTDKEVAVLFYGCFAVNALNDLLSIVNYQFGVNNVIFNSANVFMFICGYCSRRLKKNGLLPEPFFKYRVVCITILMVLYVVTRVASFQSAAIILFMPDSTVLKVNEKGSRIIDFLAGKSYSIYLLHAAVISLILKLYDNWTDLFEIKVVMIYPVVLIITVIVVDIVDFLITDRVVAFIETGNVRRDGII